MSGEDSTIAKTKSVCPICFETIPASIIEENDKIFLSKKCSKHGNSKVLLSNHPIYYKNTRDYHVAVTKNKIQQSNYLVYLTRSCNLKCPICALLTEKKDTLDLSIEELLKLACENRNSRFVLFGAEPTCRSDLCEIIKMLKKKQKIVYLYTNGVKLSNYNYLEYLRNGGVDKIFFQFDGFDDNVYKFLRGEKQLDLKLKVLGNLKKIGIPVVLNATIAKNLNGIEMGKIFNYALENSFIRTVNFTAYELSGYAKEFFPEGFLMPDELIDMLEEQTHGKINRRGMFLFQKLFYAYLSFLSRRSCFYIQFFWVARAQNSYFSIDEILDLNSIEKNLDIYKKIFIKNKFSARIYFFLIIFKLIFTVKIKRFLKDIFFIAISYALGVEEYSKKSKIFLQIIFSTGCDVHKIDLKIIKNCLNGIIYKDLSGKARIVDSDGFYSVRREREALTNKHAIAPKINVC